MPFRTDTTVPMAGGGRPTNASATTSVLPITVLLVVSSAVTAWLSATHVLTAEAYTHLLDGRVQAHEMTGLVSRMTNMSFLGYAAEPALVLARVLLVALCVQLALLGAGISHSLRAIYVACGLAYLAMAAKGLAHLVVLARVGAAAITPRALATSPLSAASAWGQAYWDHSIARYSLLDALNIFELAWCVILVMALVRLQVRVRIALPIALTIWLVVTAVQVSAAAYLSGMFR
ncbi:MAG: hypothetical protein ABJE47_12815 [bacterium]